MPEYIKTPAYPDRMPVDISFVFEDEKPAGKHGFCKAVGDEFRYEDGTLARWWGVNFNGGACFPDHDYAEQVARRLAQSGCNIVRFHQLDAEWNTPNMYCFTKGRKVTTTRVLDERSMDRLDYLIHCLKEEGIYCYMDMITYRKFKTGDGVAHADELGDSAKPYSIFDRTMIDLQKEFCDQFWNRYNKYTGLHHKDDPVFVMTEITNECDLFFPSKAGPSPYYEKKHRQLFRDWLKEKGMEYDWENCEMYVTTEPQRQFHMDLTLAYYREMYDYMRSIGVKIPITGTNWTKKVTGNVEAQKEMDFVDCHHYYYDWQWTERAKFVTNAQINGRQSIMENPGLMRVNNRPYFISEWDMPWPNAYRGEGPIYYAAVSALQNWSGMTIHTYSYAPRLTENNILGKEISSDTIAGVPYRSGIFSTWNDPAKFGLFYHAALMVRRCDLTPLKKKIGVTIPDKSKWQPNIHKTGLEIHRLATVLEGEEPVGCDEVKASTESIEREDKNIIKADNGQMWRDLKNKFGVIDTDRTKVVYGKLASGRSLDPIPGTEAKGFRVKGKSDYAVIALSSLTDDPICKSENMLLSTIGRAHNTNAKWDGDRMVEFGEMPIMSEVVTAEITIETEVPDLSVWGVGPEGIYVGKLPTKYEDGKLTFTVGEQRIAQYYLIVNE